MKYKEFKHLDHSHIDHLFNEIRCDTTDKGRFYYPQDIKMPSITTVLSVLDKGGLDAWKTRVGDVEAEKVSTYAKNRGTIIHTMAENYLNNLDWKENQMPIHIELFKKSLPDLNRIDNVLLQEQTLYSKQLKIAGRVDTIAEFNGVLSVIDFKTSKREKRAEWIESYFMQETFYACAFYEMTKIPIKQIVTIILVDDGLSQVFIEKPFKWFEKLVDARKKYSEQYSC